METAKVKTVTKEPLEKEDAQATKAAEKIEKRETVKTSTLVKKKVARIILNKDYDTFSPFPEHLRDDSSRAIGSEFVKDEKGNATMDIIRGLDHIQEKILLPDIVGVPYDHPNFLKASKDFWVDFKVKPSPEPGKSLDYTTRTEKMILGDKEVEYEHPVNLYDYMAYRFCTQSSKVAKTPSELDNKDLYQFILIDEAKLKEEQAAAYEIKEEADTAFTLLVRGTSGKEPSAKDIAKIDWVINVLKRPEEHVDLQVMDFLEKKQWIREQKNTKPATFVQAVNDPNLEYKALKVMLVDRGLLKYEGEHYYYGDQNLGKDTGVVSWLKNPSNGNELEDLRMRLEDKLKQEKTQLQI